MSDKLLQREDLLFQQPESSHLGDCPICMIPLSLDPMRYAMKMCCSKFICEGCNYEHFTREIAEKGCLPSCPYCRTPTPAKDRKDNLKEYKKQLMKRVKANDPGAMIYLGADQAKKGDYIGAFELYTKAAGLGYADAHPHLAQLYADGLGVEKDRGKEIHHLEEAAIGGHPGARHNLAVNELHNGNIERAVKHWIIAATLGHDNSVECLMHIFKVRGERSVSKEDLAAALRGHQSAKNATKSPQREAASAYYR